MMGWGTGNIGGGSGGLNFKVVGGTSEPANPKQNMIWVSTDQRITGWFFSPTQPGNMVEGEVWVIAETYGPVEFNALKKNGIQVYPISAKQYVNGALVDKTAKIYQNGKWVDWVTYLFKSGEGEKVSFSHASGINTTISATNTRVKSTVNNDSGGEWYWQTDAKQSLKDAKELVFVAKCSYQLGDGNEDYEGHFFVLSNKISDLMPPRELGLTIHAKARLIESTSTKEYVIDVSALTGSYIIAYWGVASVEIYDVFMR